MADFIPIFLAEIEKGKLIFDDRLAFQIWLEGLEGEVEVIVRKRKKRRTLDQNSFFHAYVRLICGETGDYDIEGTKQWLKDECGEKKEMIKFGKSKVVAKSTADYTPLEMSEFIKKIEVLTGILAPNPKKVVW